MTSPLFVIGQICRNRNSLANVLVSIFLKDGEVSVSVSGCQLCAVLSVDRKID